MIYKILLIFLFLSFYIRGDEIYKETCSRFSKKEAEECINKINTEIRGVLPPIEWDCNLAKEAQRWADYLSKNGFFCHDKKDKNGENIYAAGGFHPSLLDAVMNWYSEKIYFVYGNKLWCSEGYKCGHYTQLIWKDTKKIGCGISKYKKKYQNMDFVIVCKFYPPGNIMGKQPF